MKIGLISDTHGLLRPDVMTYLEGVDHILHAGDIGRREVIDGLREIAPVSAIRGNVDKGSWADDFPETAMIELAGRTFYLVHARQWLDLDPAAAGIDVVVVGHSHRPGIEKVEGVTFVNPGSAGQRRFSLPVSVAMAFIGPDELRIQLDELEV